MTRKGSLLSYTMTVFLLPSQSRSETALRQPGWKPEVGRAGQGPSTRTAGCCSSGQLFIPGSGWQLDLGPGLASMSIRTAT